MELRPVAPGQRKIIQAYGNGGFRVSGEAIAGSILVRPDLVLPWPIMDFAQVTLDVLQPLVDGTATVEILIIGCGARIALAPPALRQAVKSAGMVLETMDTGAACRTYNVLMAEERRVAAALIAVA